MMEIMLAIVGALAAFFGFSQWRRANRAEALEARTRANAAADTKADAAARLEHDRREDARKASTAARRAEDTARAEASAARIDAVGSVASEVDRAWNDAQRAKGGKP